MVFSNHFKESEDYFMIRFGYFLEFSLGNHKPNALFKIPHFHIYGPPSHIMFCGLAIILGNIAFL